MLLDDLLKVEPAIVIDTHHCTMVGHYRYDHVIAWEEGQEQFCVDADAEHMHCQSYYNAEIKEFVRLGRGVPHASGNRCSRLLFSNRPPL